MADNRNTFIAIALSLVVLLGWQYFIAKPQQEKLAAQRQAEMQAATPAPSATQGATPGAAPGTTAGVPGTASEATGPLTREQAIAATARVVIETPRLTGSISLTGARVDDLRLKDYRETVEKDSPLITLFSPKGTEHAYYADNGWVPEPGTATALPGADTVWTVTGNDKLTPESPVTLTWDNGQGVIFSRTFTIDRNYMFKVTQSVTNNTGSELKLYPYSLIVRHGTPHTAGFYILHEGLIGVAGDEGLLEIKYKDLAEEGKTTPAKSDRGWVGITDKYWAATVAPAPGSSFQPSFSYNKAADNFQADYLGDAVTIAAGGTQEAATYLFAGAKETKLLASYEESIGIDRFDLLVDWGWFYFLTKPMFYVIDWLFHLVGNFGIAILLVTVLVKAIFFPLANKSYVSMSKMKLVQPQMMDIREKYKDDKAKQQQALMELYKTEKINPLAGCLPVLVQIPVFFSLYKVLFVTIEMRHAPFFGWIQDLSAPDPTTVFNLFGLIDWTPPSMLMLGIWPIIMGITMFLQMKMNPAPTDPAQQIVFTWMPVLFTFMLASFPAGLVIYWAWNNSLSITQQYIIMRRQGVKMELWGNLKDTFKRKKAVPEAEKKS